MTENIGTADRLIRVTAGIALLAVFVFGPREGWGLVGLAGLVPLLTGIAGSCLTYTLLGINTLHGVRRTHAGS
jgi:Inner membrane protein YgaP-like, transmembrane domain